MSTILYGAQVANNLLTGGSKSKSAKKIAGKQKEMAKDALLYNRGQLEKYYNDAISSTMTQYAEQRAGMADQYLEMSSQINSMISAQGINLANSSVEDDMNNRLDFEYEINLQNATTNTVNQMANIVAGVTAQEIKLQQQYENNVYSIDNAVTKAENESKDKLYQSIFNFGAKAFDDYGSFSSRKEGNDLGAWFTSFNFGGGK